MVKCVVVPETRPIALSKTFFAINFVLHRRAIRFARKGIARACAVRKKENS